MISKAIGPLLLSAAASIILPSDGFEIEKRVDLVVDDQISYGITSHHGPVIDEILPRENSPKKVDTNSFGIVTSAKSVIVVDDESGMMLFGKRPDDMRSIGSVTKLMTAMVFLDQNPDLTQTVMLHVKDDLVIGGRQYVGFEEPIRLEQVLKASIIGSDNSATKSLMRFSGLDDNAFIEAMNEKAEELGMGSTRFTDPTGIDPYNMSSARDLVQLLKASEEYAMITQYAIEYDSSIVHAGGREVAIRNTNGLLNTFINQSPYEVIVGKTGYLPQAGYVLTSTVEHEGNRIHAIVLGSDSIDSRVNEVKALSDWAFRVFEW